MIRIADGKCPKCRDMMEQREGMFFWRGRTFSGLVCRRCNALYDDPDDSFSEALGLPLEAANSKEQP